MDKTRKLFRLMLTVEADVTTGESDVEAALNAALDEPPCDWQDWTVSGVVITGVERVLADQEVDYDDDDQD